MLDKKVPGFLHKVKLHFRSIALTNVPYNVSLRNAELVFALGWDTAHEIRHVLLGSDFEPVHSNDKRNLMFETSRSETSLPQMTMQQVAKVRTSNQCKKT